jgi:NAD(P)-dependent dehydrogenase (short-subunit alcohol dehydrogenase family)
MTLILIGRSPEPKPESSLTRNVEDINQLRRILIQLVQEKGEKPTPAQIEKDLKQLQQQRSINSNLESFRQAGAKVEYYGVDVRDSQAFGSLIESIYHRYGRIDAVIQGAGIIQDKLIVDKTTASFDQVFDTKVDSTFILSRYLRPESLKLMLLFASVAGRTGNRGQCDYAAANEVVNRFAWWMATHWSNTRVFSINWGPWDITGMASEEVNRQFRARGVIPIPPAAGCKFVIDELLYGTKADVELITGFFLGTPTESMTAKGEQTVGAQGLRPGRQGDRENINDQTTINNSLPLLNSAPQIQGNSVVILEEIISLANHPYLRDHRLDGKPVLAAACALELLAEFVQAAWSDWVVCEVHDLRVLRGIILESNSGQLVRLQAKASTHADAQSLLVTADITDGTGKILYYRGNLLLRPQFETPPVIDLPDLGSGNSLEVEKAYKNYCFHGELFQLITEIANLNEQEIDGNLRSSNAAVWLNCPSEKINWLFDPGLIDASLQMALIYARIHGDTTALPAKFGRVIRYRPLNPDVSLNIKLRINEFNPTTIIYDALLYDEDGSIHLQLQNMEGSCSKALNRLVVKA